MKIRLAAIAAAVAATPAAATDVTVIGLFPGKAVVVIDRGAPRTLAVGQRTAEGVVLLSADSRSATLEIDGKRQVLEMGRHVETARESGGRPSATLAPDSTGHFSAPGQINGSSVRFLVDTGATLVSLPASEARRLGIDLTGAKRAISQTANGPVAVYRVVLGSVKVGDITLYNVDAVVHESDALGVVLLGMSFLSRTEMHEDGGNLVLQKRY
jgi:aspartyl protease family protein